MREAVIVATSRTPLARSFKGSLNLTRPDDMAAMAIRDLLSKVPQLEPKEVEDVILGCSIPEGPQGFNLGRRAAILAGLPVTTAGITTNRFCATGLENVALATYEVMGGAEVVIAGGVESMSMLSKNFNREGILNPVLEEMKPSLHLPMGQTAEIVAKRYGISREMQDEFAVTSQMRTAQAQQEGKLRDEIFPVRGTKSVKVGDDRFEEMPFELTCDEANRPDTSMEGLANLKPIYDEQGTVTAGNTCVMGDGASTTLVMSKQRADALGIQPLGLLRGFAVAGCEPDEMGIGPIFAVPKLLKRVGVTLDEIDLIELNEAFAAQPVYVRDKLGFDPEKLNVNGGAISIGHADGMTGSRLVGTILCELRRRGGRFGLITMCVGGGMGAAGLVERT
jgi:acetyl-CoA acyltransferase